MAINSGLKRLIPAILFLSGLSVLQAQTAGYYLDPGSVEPRFIQRLAWTGGTNSLHCEVIIEKEEDAGYAPYLRQFTTGNYLDLSMPPGNYRFRVIPYDILGKPSAGTDWALFKVFSAIKPELYQPEEDLDYYNDKQGSKFEFNGKNIEPGAQIYFVNSAGERIVPTEIIRREDGSGVRVAFDKNQLVDGEYEVFIVNPGGLETSMGGIDYKTYRERFGLMHYVFGVSFMPSFQAYGDGFSSGGFLYYISGRLSIISCLFLDNYIGMEFTVSRFSKYWDELEYDQDGFTFGYSFLFINWIPDRKGAVSFRIGIGFDLQPVDLSYSNIGVSFFYRVFKNLCVEAGVNFLFSRMYGTSGDLLPWIGLAYIF